MDGLWDPPFYQGSEDTVSFSLPYDVIEDTAINEKSCLEVLEILTSKADADIVEHEEVLMDLLSQLACTDEMFSDMFIRSLTEKIDFLDSSIRKLKDDAEDFLSTRREPAESICDILKSLFCGYLQKKDLQFAENNDTASSSCCPVPADNLKKQVGGSSRANQLEKIKTVKFTPVQKQTVLPIIVKVEEENTDYSQTSPVPKYSPQNFYWGSKKKAVREVRKFQLKSPIVTKKDMLQSRTPRCNSICPKPSLETQGKRKHQLSITCDEKSMSLATVPYDESLSLPTVPCGESMSLATIPYDESMTLATIPYDESMNLETVSYDENMSLVTVPYVGSSEETTAMSLATIPYVESLEEANAKQLIVQDPDFPPGYPKRQRHQKRSISHSRNRSSTKTYTRRNKPNSPLQTSSNSHLALVVASTFDRAETYCNQYMEYNYTVSDLRAIAKERNYKGFYKLRKAELAQLLGIKLIEGSGKRPKRAETQLVPLIKREPGFAAIGF